MKNKKIFDSFKNALDGIIHTIKSERNMKIHLIAATVVIIASFLLKLSKVEFFIVCLCIALVIICELFNTAIEVMTDIIVDVYHPKAKIVKDVSAGAVFISALISIIVAYFVFFDKIVNLILKNI